MRRLDGIAPTTFGRGGDRPHRHNGVGAYAYLNEHYIWPFTVYTAHYFEIQIPEFW